MSVTVQSQVDRDADLFSAFEASARQHGQRPALIADGGRGTTYTYADVSALAGNLAAGLGRDQYAAVRQIGLLSENRPEWAIAYLAILAAGRTVVPIDANLKPREIEFVVRDAGIRVVFTSGRFLELVRSLLPDAHVFSFETQSPCSWADLADSSGSVVKGRLQQTAVLIYTSGTTGAPKAVELTHRNLLSNLAGIRQALSFDHTDTFLSVLPLHHTFEATCGLLTPLMSGACVVYARSLKSRELLEDIAANDVTLMCGVPLLFEKLYHSIQRKLAAARFARRLLFRILYALAAVGRALGLKWGRALFCSLRAKAGLGAVRMFFSGAAALPPKIARFFNLIGFDFCQGYGLTECSPVVSVNRPGDIKFGSVGPPLHNLTVKIDHPDQWGIGEILVKGDAVTPGYRDNPEETAGTIVDGWLRTGDLGRLKDGHLWITGRKKNVIVSAAGKNIYPEELEERLLESNCILEAVVFGRKKQGKQGEEVRAIIVPDGVQLQVELGLSADAPDLDQARRVISTVVKNVNDHLADYKRISGFDVQLQELEKTSTKKVKRFLYR